MSAASASEGTQPLLHEIFQEGAVLQRDRPIPIWGRADAGAKVTVRLAEHTVTVPADAAGRWQAMLPSMAAGGPYSLVASSDRGGNQTVADVLVGDVWLCSGQSNMVLQVHRSLDSRAEIANAANDRIRMLTIAQTSSVTPLEQFAEPAQWHKAVSASVGEFSATCYYFARELQKSVQVPMGLINASWGGSRIEAWMSRDALRAVGGYDLALELLERYVRDPVDANTRWGRAWEAWWRAQPPVRKGDEPWAARREPAGTWRVAPPALGPWEEWGDPELADYNGLVWYRASMELSVAQARQPAVLVLGAVDEIDQTWVNGRPAGNTSGPGVHRRYTLPRGTLQAGTNYIAVAALDTYASGGMHGPARDRAIEFSDGTSVTLGEWHYRKAPAGLGPPPRAPWEATGGAGTIRNGMIAPLGSYGVRGVLWYQGESNTEDSGRYERLLQALIADWRTRHGEQLPVLVVQLANYGMPPTRPAESGWAEVREAQRRVAKSDPHVGLAVAIDIGDRYDIHPANKQEVGRRLARAARHVVYGESIPASGPAPIDARRQGDTVAVSFRDVTGSLVAYGAETPIGFELCGSEPRSCRYASARIDGGRVELRVPDMAEPQRVRYCWADSPVCTLYDEAHLPAGPFEIALHEESRR